MRQRGQFHGEEQGQDIWLHHTGGRHSIARRHPHAVCEGRCVWEEPHSNLSSSSDDETWMQRVSDWRQTESIRHHKSAMLVGKTPQTAGRGSRVAGEGTTRAVTLLGPVEAAQRWLGIPNGLFPDHAD